MVMKQIQYKPSLSNNISRVDCHEIAPDSNWKAHSISERFPNIRYWLFSLVAQWLECRRLWLNGRIRRVLNFGASSRHKPLLTLQDNVRDQYSLSGLNIHDSKTFIDTGTVKIGQLLHVYLSSACVKHILTLLVMFFPSGSKTQETILSKCLSSKTVLT